MTAKINLTGQRFGRLVVTSEAGNTSAGKARWTCLCDCGTTCTIRSTSLRGGITTSCGCLHRELASALLRDRGDIQRAKAKSKLTTHGCTAGRKPTRAYRTWLGMVKRCHNPADHSFPRYGGRGIFVCERWRSSFEAFLADMGEPAAALTIDRIDNDGPYSAENCRWATPIQQARNKRTSRMVAFRGESLSVAEWAERTGLSAGCIARRLDAGWEVEPSLTKPSRVALRAGAL